MKILWLYRYVKEYNYDHFLHMDIAECMNGLMGIEVKCYGPGLHMSTPRICLEEYNADTTLEHLFNKFSFDIIVICTKSRMFFNYRPVNAMGNTTGEIAEGEWLPKDFMSFSKGNRVVFEEDYHYEANDIWYKNRGVSIIFHRHYCNVVAGSTMTNGVRHVFFPFSIDPKVFYDRGYLRTNAMKSVGSINNQYYLDRKTANIALSGAGLLSTERCLDGAYAENLNRFTCHLSTQSLYNILPAKIFEIAACGSVLFTNANPKSGIDKVFSPGAYVAWKDDFSDIIDKADWLLKDRESQKAIVHRAKLEVMMRHTHTIRTKEFLEIMKNA